ncbi:Replication termination factor 2 [Dimargaris verticillata]|uniref:Replication termination factor 2 n=1 Tax=Dimargaris verticillata TaxID=2761393 RepID=A0A9W8B3Z8_9FUNG|nr:Replication termination factor 2 [Dimargaris verticillata]
MGNDGGTIPRRSEMVRQKARAEKLDEKTLARAKYTLCALSKRPLHPPLVACGLGNLYNKDALLEHLLNTTKSSDTALVCPHVRSLKDVTNVTVTLNPSYQPTDIVVTSSVSASTAQGQHYPVLCPITLKELNGTTPFVFSLACGCVCSQAALSEVKSATTQCLQCGTTCTAADWLPLYPQGEQLQQAKDRLSARKAELALAKKNKKAKKRARTGDHGSDESTPALATASVSEQRMTPSLRDTKRKRTSVSG